MSESDIHIPGEALEAAAKEALFSDTPNASAEYKAHVWRTIGDGTKQKYREIARAACLAMLRAWPRMTEAVAPIYEGGLVWSKGVSIILPLTQEPRDE